MNDYSINEAGCYKWKICESCMSFEEDPQTGEHCAACEYPGITTSDMPIGTKPTNYAPAVLVGYPETTFDAVSHPSHYTEGRQYEPRKVIHDWGLNFNLGNAVKYISRAGRKGDALEDLKKARQYLDFEIEEMEKEDK